MTRKQAPLGVEMISVLSVVSGILAVIWGLGWIGSGLGIPLVAIGLGEFVLAWGLWEMQSWAWTLAVVLYGFSTLVSAVGVVNGGSGIPQLVVSVVLLAYLLSVRDHFRDRGRGRAY